MTEKPELAWLHGRRSVRRYRPEPIPPQLIDQLLTAAIWAPSAHNRQPWRFAIIQDPPTRHNLATAMGQQLRADLQADQVAETTIAQDTGRSYQRLTTAPLLILLCLSMADMDNYPDPQRQQQEWTMAVQSVAMAGQNLLLAAHTLGLAGCWLCAPLFCPDIVCQCLGLPADWQPQGFIAVGYPAGSRPQTRHPLATKVKFI